MAEQYFWLDPYMARQKELNRCVPPQRRLDWTAEKLDNFLRQAFPYTSNFPLRSLSDRGAVQPAVKEWLEQPEHHGQWCFYVTGRERFFFDNETTALLFKLRWS